MNMEIHYTNIQIECGNPQFYNAVSLAHIPKVYAFTLLQAFFSQSDGAKIAFYRTSGGLMAQAEIHL